jgi:hypothetical protein
VQAVRNALYIRQDQLFCADSNANITILMPMAPCCRTGLYKLPWDMTVGHRQTNPLFVLQQAVF